MFTLFILLGSSITYTVKQPYITCREEHVGLYGLRLHPKVTNMLGEHYNVNLTIEYSAYIIRRNHTVTYSMDDSVLDSDMGLMWILMDAIELEVTIYTDNPTIPPFTGKYYIGDVDQAWLERKQLEEGVDVEA